MVTVARARVALAQGDAAAALVAYAPLLSAAAPCAPWLRFDKLVAARLLASRGRLDEAARILNAPPQIEGAASAGPRSSDVLWYLERGHVAERLGDGARALEAYRFVATRGGIRILSSSPLQPMPARD